jgi:cell division protein FtsL
VSEPARNLDPVARTRRVRSPATSTTAQPPARSARAAAARPPHSSPPQRVRARRGSPVAFWILASLVAAAMILAIASLSALFVQASFQIDHLQSQVQTLTQQHEVLREQVAADSSPQRVMRWAQERGLLMPDRVVIVHLQPDGSGG